MEFNEEQIQGLLDNGLTPEETEKFDAWEDGLTGEFWNNCFVPFLKSQEATCEKLCCLTEDEDEWRKLKGKLEFIRATLKMRDFIRTSYATTALSRLDEMESEFESAETDYV